VTTIESAKRAVAAMELPMAHTEHYKPFPEMYTANQMREFATKAVLSIAAIREMKDEPVAWEYREKSRHGWHAWSECSQYYFDDYQNDKLTGGISCREFIEVRALYLHPSPAERVIPEGWRLVPVEPSAAMLQCMDKGSAYQTWKNMIAQAQDQDHE
jgi:hypothetical protein